MKNESKNEASAKKPKLQTLDERALRNVVGGAQKVVALTKPKEGWASW
jgi:hypothetical protein